MPSPKPLTCSVVLLDDCDVYSYRRRLGKYRAMTVVATVPEEECDATNTHICFPVRGRKRAVFVPHGGYVVIHDPVSN